MMSDYDKDKLVRTLTQVEIKKDFAHTNICTFFLFDCVVYNLT